MKINWVLTIILAVCAVYFFSYQLQVLLVKLLNRFSKRIGMFSREREIAIQRYVFLNRSGRIAKAYNWVNEQLIALGLKSVGVTPVGYLLFWGFIAITVTVILKILGLPTRTLIPLTFILYAIFLILTRVLVSSRMERQEEYVMDAIDLMIPQLASNSVHHTIDMYKNNFHPSIQHDFNVFLTNVSTGSFEDAMHELADNLGYVFRDFAWKAINYEIEGDPNMLIQFDDITETNKLRRKLRFNINQKFSDLKIAFLVSVGIVTIYFIFLVSTDAYARHFFFNTTAGGNTLIVFGLIIFAVLSYIATIKSRPI